MLHSGRANVAWIRAVTSAPNQRQRGPHPLAAHLAALWASTTQCSLAAAALPETAGIWHSALVDEVADIAAQLEPGSIGGFASAVQARLIERLDAVHRGLRAYQRHDHVRQLAPMPALAEAGSARLLAYGGRGPPVVFVPSLINPAWVLDLDEESSMLRWLTQRGHRVMLVEWGAPGPAEADFTLDDYAAGHLSTLLAALDEPVALVGYCLGGTLSIATAQLFPAQVRALALLATPWNFSGYPKEAREGLFGLWSAWSATAGAFGALPMEALQLAFASLDPTLMERKFAGFADMPPDSPAARQFVVLEDWANSGPPLVAGAARQAFEQFFSANVTGAGQWRIGNQSIVPEAVNQPSLVVHAHPDRLVPFAASQPLGESIPKATTLQAAAGHVGMIVGSRARHALWQPLSDWLDATLI
jgi:polyhydroxyalkanoate synthase subunit PhaC